MTAGKGIPFVDLVAPHVELQDELMAACKDVLTTGMFIGGPNVEQFEREFAQFCDAKYCVGVSSGTDALRFALMAADVGKGDIVISVPNTFVATVEAIVQAGATAKLVDVDPQTFNISVDALRQFLQTQCDRPDKTGLPVHRESGLTVKAIIPVHLYGQMCDMDSIMGIAEEYGLIVIEDACQAHGSEYFSAKKNAWQKAGSIGKAAGFSFYPGKNLGACGEAGAVTTNDETLAVRMRMIRDHGQNKKYHHLVEGYNGRLDALQAALLRVKLPHLKEWTAQRRKAAETYNELLKGVSAVRIPFEPKWSRAVYHLYVVCATKRDELQKRLTENHIGTGLHYPVPVHLQEAYANLGYRAGDFPVTERLAAEILSLPMYPQLQKAQQEQIVEVLMEFYGVGALGKQVLQ
jgi:dTDP-4-amino-4,6-dideoxygalactose transaminase